MRIGAHVSSAGSIDKAIDRAQAIGAEAIQIFVSPPQGWRLTEHKSEALESFVKKAHEAAIGPVYLHGVYLVNLATENRENLEKGIASLAHYMRICPETGAEGIIFHVGSHKGVGFEAVLGQVVESVKKVLDQSPQGILLCLENNAGQGQQIGASFGELGRIMQEVGDPRVRVCLDTAHSLASSYDVASAEGLARTMEEFDREIGLSNLAAVHANDSKIPLGGNVDRHENIGEGHIGLEGFRHILAHPAFRDVPFFLEVPGFEGNGPDAENVARLKAIRDEVGVPA